MIEVARVVFARSGYRGATTREIAERAGISEALVLKHFGTKEQLFRAAVADPLLAILAWATRNSARAPESRTSIEEEIDQAIRLIREWARVMRAERQLLLTVIPEFREFPDVAADLTKLLKAHITDLARAGQRANEASDNFRSVDAEVGAYVTLAVATIAALLADDTERFVREASKILLYGFVSDVGRARLANASPPH